MPKITYLTPHEGKISNREGTAIRGTDRGYDKLLLSFGGRHGPFLSEHVTFEGGYISGTNRIGSDDFDTTFEEWPSFWRDTGAIPWPPEQSDLPSKEELSTRLIAETQPSKPKYDIGRAIGELKDLPHMLRGIGKDFIHRGFHDTAGRLSIEYRFGWAPFAADIASLFKCQAAIKSRFDSLNHLRKNGTAIRKRNLYDETNTTHGEGVSDYWKFSLSTTVREHCWGYTIWGTNQAFPTTDEDLFQLARRCAAGLTIRPKVFWDLLPWSWAIDWFSNVGQFLQATDNIFGVDLLVANLCVTTERLRKAVSPELVGTHNEHFKLSISDMEYYSVQRARFKATPPTITAWLPALSGDQLGILAAIDVQKYRRFL